MTPPRVRIREVGPRDGFQNEPEVIPTDAKVRLIDLLARSGVEEVEASDLCTSCERELFFSHRRDQGRTGRQAGMVRRWPS